MKNNITEFYKEYKDTKKASACEKFNEEIRKNLYWESELIKYIKIYEDKTIIFVHWKPKGNTSFISVY